MSSRFNAKPAATAVEKNYNSLTLEEQQKQMLNEASVSTPRTQEQRSRFYEESSVKTPTRTTRGTQTVQLDTEEVTRITLRLDSELAEAAKKQAKKESRSLNTLIALALKEYLSK